MMIKFTLMVSAALGLAVFTNSAHAQEGQTQGGDTSQAADAASSNLPANMELNKKISTAAETYRNFVQKNQNSVPQQLVQGDSCVAVVPGVKRTALLLGSTSGQGVVSCKRSGGEWSTPSFVSVSGKSIGLQLGRQSSDVVMYLVGEEAVKEFLEEGEVELGKGVDVYAGPIGTNVNLPSREGAYSYVKNEKGLFAGLSLQGSELEVDDDANEEFYGEDASAEKILGSKDQVVAPPSAETFIQVIQQQQPKAA